MDIKKKVEELVNSQLANTRDSITSTLDYKQLGFFIKQLKQALMEHGEQRFRNGYYQAMHDTFKQVGKLCGKNMKQIEETDCFKKLKELEGK